MGAHPDKTFKTYDEQRELLLSRGLIIDHPRFFAHALQRDDYYNIINGYKKHFIASMDPEQYIPGVTFENVYALYTFDQSMRGLFLIELLKIEKHIKSLVAYHFSEKHGYDHRTYLNINSFKHDSAQNRKYAARLIKDINQDIAYYQRRGNNAICHYLNEYQYVPLWVLNSVLSFGKIAHFYSCMYLDEQQAVAQQFKMSAKCLDGFIYYLGDIRNTCAHGGRVYTPNKSSYYRKNIPDTSLHKLMAIPRNGAGNYIAGKNDILAAMISFKYFLGKAEFRILKKKLKRAHDALKKSIPVEILSKVDSELGLNESRYCVL